MKVLIRLFTIVWIVALISACEFEDEEAIDVDQLVAKIAPIANVGSDISTNENTIVTLDGSDSSDSDGSIVEYRWTQSSGSQNVVISNDDQAIATFTAPDVNSDIQLVFELTVTDDDGISSIDYKNVTVLKVNQQPIANAPASLDAIGNELVTMDGSSSIDSDGTIASYAWIQTSGTSVAITNANQSIASFTAPNIDAQLGFQLTVTDNDGSTNSRSLIVNLTKEAPVIVENQAPVANAGSDQTIDEKTLTSLNGNASNDPDGTIVSYSWVQISGGNVAISNANQAVASITGPDVETDTPLTFQLTVTDNEGASSSDTTVLLIQDVLEPNRAPTAVTANNFSVNENAQVTLDGSASNDSDGTISSYSWTQIAGSPVVVINSPTAAVASFTAPEVTESTSLTFNLVVTDNEGANASDTIVVSITDVPVNQAPVISGIPESSVTEDEFYTFTPEASDPEEDTLTFSVSNLPEWASFDTLSGTISGTPVTADIGYYDNITITVSDGELSGSLTEISIDVLAAPVLIPENPLLSEVGGYSISMGTSIDSITDQGTLGISSDTISSVDLEASDTYYISVNILDTDGNNLLESNDDIIGYRVYAGTTSDTLYPVVELVGGPNSVFSISEPFDSGTYYLSIVVFESAGYEGTLSDVIQLNTL